MYPEGQFIVFVKKLYSFTRLIKLVHSPFNLNSISLENLIFKSVWINLKTKITLIVILRTFLISRNKTTEFELFSARVSAIEISLRIIIYVVFIWTAINCIYFQIFTYCLLNLNKYFKLFKYKYLHRLVIYS